MGFFFMNSLSCDLSAFAASFLQLSLGLTCLLLPFFCFVFVPHVYVACFTSLNRFCSFKVNFKDDLIKNGKQLSPSETDLLPMLKNVIPPEP